MAKLLYVGTHGVDDPTKAGLVFVLANGAKSAGHDPSIVLAGDATMVMNEDIAENTAPVAFPPIKEIMAATIANGTPIGV